MKTKFALSAVVAALAVLSQTAVAQTTAPASRADVKAETKSGSLARPGEARIDVLFGGDVDLAEDAADVLRHRFALLFVHVEDGDADAVGRQRPNGGFAEARGAAGDDG